VTASRLLRIVRLRLRTLLHPRDVAVEIDREFAFHLEQLAQEKEAEGLSRDAAWRAARREFGNAAALTDRSRDARGLTWLEDLRHDAVYGWRMLRRTPGFAAVATLSLAVGIGANAAVAGAIAAVAARPLPFLHADRLVAIRAYQADHPSQSQAASMAEYLAWQQRSRTLDAFGASRSGPRVIRTTADAPADRVQGQAFTPSLFATLGIRPAMGALFAETTNPYSKDALVVVISHRLWQRHFGGAGDAIGRTMTVDGARRVIAGVLPPGFHYQDDNVELWIPLIPGRDSTPPIPAARTLAVTARLKPGVTLAQAQADLDEVSAALAAETPELAGWRVRLVPLRDTMYGWTRPRLLTLAFAVATVLLLTCANIAALLLARGASRQRELAMRVALGASTGRLVRQLLTESLLIGLFAGIAGLLVARAGLTMLTAALGPPPGLPRLGAIPLDGWIAGGAILLGIGSSIAFGWLPARAIARLDVGSALGAAATLARVAPRAPRWRGILVASQVAAAEVLLVGAILLGVSFVRLSGRELNFEPRGLLTFSYGLRAAEFARATGVVDGEREFEISPIASQTIARVYDRLRALPGAHVVGGISYPPVNSIILPTTTVRPAGASSAPPLTRTAAYFLVTPRLFAAMQTPLISGREFADADTGSAPWGAVVNETLARLCWPGEDPVGKLVALGDGRLRQVIGLVPDIPTRLNWADPQPVIYTSFLQQPAQYRGRTVPMFGEMTFVLRHSGDAAGLLAAARQTVAGVTPDRALVEVDAVDARLRARLPESRNYVIAVSAVALAAAGLAMIGLYGVIAHTVTARAGEIAIRKALGAGRRDLVALISRPVALLVLPGLALGAAAALVLSPLIAAQLWGTTPRDPAILAAAAIALAAAALLACAAPLSRALAVDPARRLRCE